MFILFTFFHFQYKKKVFESWKFLGSIYDGFTRFGISWTRFHYFYKLSICKWPKFCSRASAKTDGQNYMKF